MTAHAHTQINLTVWQKKHDTTEPSTSKMTENTQINLNHMIENTQIQPKHIMWLGHRYVIGPSEIADSYLMYDGNIVTTQYISTAHCDLLCKIGLWQCWDNDQAERPRNPGLIPGRGKMLLFSIKCRPALRPPQRPAQWIMETCFPGGEADHSPPPSTEVKNGKAISPVHPSSGCTA
jgi:hypothetical protein